MKQHLVIRKMQKERKNQEDKESSLKKLCTKAGKKLKKIKDINPDVVRAVMQDDGNSDDEDCITLDSDDEGIDFTDPKWMEEFLTDEDRQRDVKPNVADLDKAIEEGRSQEADKETERESSSEREPIPNGAEPVAVTKNGNLASMNN